MALKRLEQQSIEADISAVRSLLASRTPEEDPIAWMQFNARLSDLGTELLLLKAASTYPTAATIALLFGGLPVIGSRGIDANFGSEAVACFQDVISKRYAEHHQDGPLGTRGPIKHIDHTAMMITDVVRGSVGFVLEEVDNSLIETPLKTVVDEVVDLIHRTASPDQEAFDAFAETVDQRVLGSLRLFFRLLDDKGATMRLVDDHREVVLSREAIDLGRTRTDATEISENIKLFEGTLYILPDTKRFDLHATEGTIRGVVANDLIRRLVGLGQDIPVGILGTKQAVKVMVRNVTGFNVAPRTIYRLLDIESQPMSSSEDNS